MKLMHGEAKSPIANESTPEPLHAAASSVSASKIQEILNRTDWNDYWRQVGDAAASEIEAYRRAAARSGNSDRVLT